MDPIKEDITFEINKDYFCKVNNKSGVEVFKCCICNKLRNTLKGMASHIFNLHTNYEFVKK
jgi:hypothetical protein